MELMLRRASPSLRRVAVTVASTALALVSLSGCTQPAPEEASVLTMPDTVWSNRAPQGEADTSEWADALRQRTRIENLAFILGDYSDPELIHELGYDDALAAATHTQKARFDEPNVWGGMDKEIAMAKATASILEVLSVTPSSSGDSAHVEVCLAFFGYTTEKFDAGVVPYEITRLGDERYEIERGSLSFDPTCSPAQLPHEVWAVPFDPENVGRDTVKMPLPREYYIDLGVISE